jgi:hypothetical protein
MIYLVDKEAERAEFEQLLQRVKSSIKKKLDSGELKPSKITPTNFEEIVLTEAEEAAKGTSFEGKLKNAGKRAFPDIVDGEHFGIEVKSTIGDTWVSLGNSVFESSRVKNTEKIYVFFGKFGGRPDVDFKKYEECLQEISVTHSPRYELNMRITAGETVLDKMGTTYDELRALDEPIIPIREYYSRQLKPGQTLWWLSNNLDDATSPTPVIKDFSSIEQEEQRRIIAESMVLFPEVFKIPSATYTSVAVHLVSKYGIISSSLRDKFSAGGQAIIMFNGKEISLPHVVGEMLDKSELIKKELVINDIQLDDWLKSIDNATSGITVKYSDIFRSGKFIKYTKK